MVWEEVAASAMCDHTKGEVYRQESPGKVSSLAACQHSCEADTGCRSITYFTRSGGCSHFSTACTATKKNNNAIAMRLKEVPRATTVAQEISTHPGQFRMRIVVFACGKECR